MKPSQQVARYSFDRELLEKQRELVDQELKALEQKYSHHANTPALLLPNLSGNRDSDKRSYPNQIHQKLSLIDDQAIELPPIPLPLIQSSRAALYASLRRVDTPPQRHSQDFESPKRMPRVLSQASPDILSEISALRFDYLRAGGSSVRILDSLGALEAQAMAFVKNSGDATVAQGMMKHLGTGMGAAADSGRSLPDANINPSSVTFRDIDAIEVPPYDENRGFSVFIDVMSGIPYYGGGDTVKMQIFHAAFDGTVPLCPVETVDATCQRQTVTFAGNALVQHSHRFYDIRASNNARLMFQFTITNPTDDTFSTIADIKPIAWTTFDLFSDLNFNHGRWRLNMFYPPVDLRVTSYHAFSTLPVIPNLFAYIRIVNPALERHNKSIQLNQVDFRSEYKPFKPAYHPLELYQAVEGARRFVAFEDEEDGTLARSGSLDGVKGSVHGSRATIMGSTNSLGDSQVVFCNLGVRIETVQRLFLGSHLNLKVRVNIGTQNEEWTSETAEVGFDPGTFGWSNSAGQVLWKDVPIRLGSSATLQLLSVEKTYSEHETVIASTPLDVFHRLEDDSIVVNERALTMSIEVAESETFCDVSLRIFTDSKIPAPFEFDSKRLAKHIPDGAWIHVPRKEVSVKELPVPSAAVSFSVDGVRFLPENTTITRIQCRIMSADLSRLDGFETMDFMPDFDSPAYFPRFSSIAEIKFPTTNPASMNATTVAVLKLYTIDRYSRQLVTIGVAYFNLFVNEKFEPPEAADAGPIHLNQGYHQIPVLKCGIESPSVRNVFKQSMPRVPCTSVLLRLFTGEELPPRVYKDCVYYSEPSRPLDYESGLFYHLLRERPLTDIKAALAYLKQDVKAANDDALVSWMAKRIAKEQGLLMGMDMSCILRYHEGWGIKVSVDCADMLKNKAFSIAIISLSPPGSLYNTSIRRPSGVDMAYNDVKYNKKLDFQSSVRSPVWKDGFQCFEKVPFHPKLTAIIDIRCLGYSELDKQYRLQQQGWAILSLVHSAGFVKFGSYQLPLFDGAPSQKLLNQLSKAKDEDVDDWVVRNLKSKSLKYAKKRGSLFVRVCDPRREKEIPFSKEDAVATQAVASKALFEFDDSVQLFRVLPSGVSEQEYESRCLNTLVELSNLPKEAE
ncbi:Coiled-coil domain-containing protein 17 [Chytriomyces hyalinus]|nr:Coiled-coil domain-containing protein 17 [Chytriomyces hyalinus]